MSEAEYVPLQTYSSGNVQSSPPPSNKHISGPRIYLEILKLEQERQEAKNAEALALAEAQAAQQSQYTIEKETEAGRKFLAKVMQRRKQRQQAANNTLETPASTPSEKELSPPANAYPIRERPPAKGQKPDPTAGWACPTGLGPLKKCNQFTLKLTPPECCGGPRLVDIYNTADKVVLNGTIDSDTEYFLRPPGLEPEDPLYSLITMKCDELKNETSISFPDLENIAYICKPIKAKRISPQQEYEIDTGEGYSNHFNFGIEVGKGGTPRNPEYVFKMINPNLTNVATIVLLSNYRTAEVIMDENLWPSQKAVILATGFYMIWDMVQEIRRKAAYIKVIIVSAILLIACIVIILVLTYDWSGDENLFNQLNGPPPEKTTKAPITHDENQMKKIKSSKKSGVKM